MSNPRVTITLGRSGQVVKRAAPLSDGMHLDRTPSVGSKRPMRERLGSNVENPQFYGSWTSIKRRRQANDRRSDDGPYISHDRIAQDDLRFKLLRKNSSRRKYYSDSENQNGDLREKLSRFAPSSSVIDTPHRMPGTRNTRTARRIPPTRSADDLLQLDSLRRSYSSWTLDGLKRRSPERPLGGASRALSPPRNMHALHSVQSSRSIDTSRPSSFLTKDSVPLESAKSVARLAPTANGITQKPAYPAEEYTVASLLHALGLGKYAILFQAEEVDMTALKQMGDTDLKELGIPMTPRVTGRGLPKELPSKLQCQVPVWGGDQEPLKYI
ncbi:hypothetical protein AMTRI_Chr10g229520 [Amborella trichopoda]